MFKRDKTAAKCTSVFKISQHSRRRVRVDDRFQDSIRHTGQNIKTAQRTTKVLRKTGGKNRGGVVRLQLWLAGHIEPDTDHDMAGRLAARCHAFTKHTGDLPL